MKLTIFGTITEDTIIRSGKETTTLGGAPFFFCKAADRFGTTMVPISTIGKNDIKYLSEKNTNTSFLKVTNATTRLIVNADLEKPTCYVENVNEKIDVAALPNEVFDSEIITMSTLSDEFNISEIVERTNKNAIVAADIQGFVRASLVRGLVLNELDKKLSRENKKLLSQIKILKCNEFESLLVDSTLDLKQRAANISKLGPKIVIITLGEKGSLIFDNGAFIEQPAVGKLNRTLGAGDLFFAAFLCNLSAGTKEAAKIAAEFVYEVLGSEK